ncbi:hypothetical protein CerSpe_272010 [Prunus speciosa]
MIKGFKINFDGAFHTGLTGGGVRVVIRDKDGRFLAALAKRVLFASSAEHVECLAAHEAVRFWWKMGGQTVRFEGDSLNTIQDVLSSEVNLSPLGQLIEDIQSSLRDHRRDCFSFVRREANGVAHCLAKFAVNCSHPCEWVEVPPDFIQDALDVDSCTRGQAFRPPRPSTLLL